MLFFTHMNATKYKKDCSLQQEWVPNRTQTFTSTMGVLKEHCYMHSIVLMKHVP